MKIQSYENHARIHPFYHFFGSVVILFTLIGATVNLVSSILKGADVFPSLLMAAVVIGLVVIFVLVRIYALQVQDRVIRAEENFRHYRLTNRVLDSRLTMKQIIALRFASDEEFVQLCEKAIDENLKPVEIKKAIRIWKEDNDRV